MPEANELPEKPDLSEASEADLPMIEEMNESDIEPVEALNRSGADRAKIKGRHMQNGYAFMLSDDSQQGRKPVSEEEYAEAMEKLTFLKELVNGKLKEFLGERRGSRSWAFFFTVSSSVLAALVSFLLGFKEPSNAVWFSNIALALSTAIAVITVWSKFWDAKDLWVQYTDTVNYLEELKSHIEYTEKGVDKTKALRLKEVEILRLKYHQIMNDTARFVHNVRAQS